MRLRFRHPQPLLLRSLQAPPPKILLTGTLPPTLISRLASAIPQKIRTPLATLVRASSQKRVNGNFQNLAKSPRNRTLKGHRIHPPLIKRRSPFRTRNPAISRIEEGNPTLTRFSTSFMIICIRDFNNSFLCFCIFNHLTLCSSPCCFYRIRFHVTILKCESHYKLTFPLRM